MGLTTLCKREWVAVRPWETYLGSSSSCISSKSGFLCIDGWQWERVVGVCWQSEQLLNTEVGKGLGVWRSNLGSSCIFT